MSDAALQIHQPEMAETMQHFSQDIVCCNPGGKCIIIITTTISDGELHHGCRQVNVRTDLL
jgi:hypothetical protein